MFSKLPIERPIGKVKAEPVALELREKAKQTVAQCIALACNHYGGSFPMPSISFDLRGRTGGKAYLKKNHVQLNSILYTENAAEFIKQVIPHEVAHLINHGLHGEGVAPHGEEWQGVMRVFGLEPDRTHRMDTTNSRTQASFAYKCPCKSYALSTTRHNKSLRGNRFYCNKCDGILVWENEDADTIKAKYKPVLEKTKKRKKVEASDSSLLRLVQRVISENGLAVPPAKLKDAAFCRALIARYGNVAARPTMLRIPVKLPFTPPVQRPASTPTPTWPPARVPAPAVPPNRSVQMPTLAPTDKQRSYASSIALKKKLVIPHEALIDRVKMSAWISEHC